MFESGAACNYQVQYIRDRNALPITRDYMLETEQEYRQLGAGTGTAKKPRNSTRRKSLETTDA
jgi:cyclopropane-fatty-acyl-phospholipid synthase